jgi:hypothetical protein
MFKGEALTRHVPRAGGDLTCFVVDEMPGGEFWLGVQRGDLLIICEMKSCTEAAVRRAEELRFEPVGARTDRA